MTDSMLPVVLLIGIATAMASSMLLAGWYFGRPARSGLDRTPYECGIKPFDRLEQHRFSVHFYLVAMLFILFDIEAAFLIPWAVTFQDFKSERLFVLGEMAVFLGILIAGYAYLWRRGALEWE